jgi:hypothetical protein
VSGKIPKMMNGRQARAAAVALSGLRAAIGLGVFVVPSSALAPWVGAVEAKEPVARLLGRSLGARDLALAAGALLSMRHEAPLRGWVEGGMLSDAGDVVATLALFGKLPRLWRWAVLGMTIGSVLAGLAISAAVDEDPAES